MKLKEFKVNSGGKFNPDSPVVIDFTQSNFVKLEGDNKLGKTTLLELLLFGCGQLSGKDIVDKLKNKENDKIDVELSFIGKDRKSYEVKATKSAFKLMYEGESLPSPLSKMKEVLGVVGVSPMEIKNKPLKEIVKWLASYSNKNPEEFALKLDKLKKDIKSAITSRADANRTVKGLNEYLNSESLFINWEDSEKKYKTPVDTKSLSLKLDEAGKKSDKLLQAETKLKQLKERQDSVAAQIENLQKEMEEVSKSVKMGEKFVEDNKTAKKEYDDTKKKYDNAAVESVNYNKWKDIQAKKKEKDQFETISQKFDATEKDLMQEVKSLQMEILPDIKGVEMVTEDTHENGGAMVKEGFYWNGISAAQLSESEWWSFVLMIWRKLKVRVIVIDNYQSLGSMAVEILEKLEKEGCYILCAEMNREQKTLEIEYK